MHNNLTERCINYFENALVIADQDEYFFPSGKTHRIKSDTFYQYYRKILHLAGIRNCNASGGPRLHDIRHPYVKHTTNNKSLQSQNPRPQEWRSRISLHYTAS